MRVRNFQFLSLLIVLGLLSLFTGCNLIDTDVNPIEQKGNPIIATSDNVQVRPGSGVVIDLFKNDQITTSANVTLLKDYLKKGTAEFIQQGVVLYTPTDSLGIDTLAYTICTPGQPCDTGAVEISIGPNISDTTRGAQSDFVFTTPNQSVGIDVLQNDSFGDSTSQDTSNRVVDIVQMPKNGNAKVDNGYFVTYTPNQGFQGTDQFVYGVRNVNTNIYLGYGVVTVTVGDTVSNGCIIRAVEDSSAINRDSLNADGTNIYLNVLSNDEFCNQQLTPVIINNGGFNDVSFDNGQLKVKMYSTDQLGTYTVRYALKIDGSVKSEANVIINLQSSLKGCTISAFEDRLVVPQDTLAQDGTYMFVNVLANDELCNTQAVPEVLNNGGFNDVSFVNNQLRIKLFATDPKGTYTVRYALKENGSVKSEADIKITIQ